MIEMIPNLCEDQNIVIDNQQRTEFIQYCHNTVEPHIFILINDLGK